MKILEVASLTGQGPASGLAKKAVEMLKFDIAEASHLVAYADCAEYTCPSFAALVGHELDVKSLVSYDINSLRLSLFNWLRLKIETVHIGVEVVGTSRCSRSVQASKRASVIVFAPDTFSGGTSVTSDVQFGGSDVSMHRFTSQEKFGSAVAKEKVREVKVREVKVVEASSLQALASPIHEWCRFRDSFPEGLGRFVWRETYGSGVVEFQN